MISHLRSLRRSALADLRGAAGITVVVLAMAATVILVTRSPNSAVVIPRATGASPTASPIFTLAEAEAAASRMVEGLTREEAKLTTWAGYWAWVDTYFGGVAGELPAGPPSADRQVWVVAVSGSVCCYWDYPFQLAPWGVFVYDATTGDGYGVNLGSLSSGGTWPPGLNTIRDRAS